MTEKRKPNVYRLMYAQFFLDPFFRGYLRLFHTLGTELQNPLNPLKNKEILITSLRYSILPSATISSYVSSYFVRNILAEVQTT